MQISLVRTQFIGVNTSDTTLKLLCIKNIQRLDIRNKSPKKRSTRPAFKVYAQIRLYVINQEHYAGRISEFNLRVRTYFATTTNRKTVIVSHLKRKRCRHTVNGVLYAKDLRGFQLLISFGRLCCSKLELNSTSGVFFSDLNNSRLPKLRVFQH